MKAAKRPDATSSTKINEEKWTKELMAAGWTVLPNVIFERQAVLGLDAIDINILLHLASYWWKPGDKPHPSKVTIAAAIGIDPRTVQRRIARMEKDGYVRREERRIKGIGSRPNIYHLEGLIEKATPYALEKVQERAAKEAEKKARAARKGRPRLQLVKIDED